MLAEMATNILFSMWLPLFLALLFIAYFLFVSPLVGPWIASGRYAQGWFLGGKRTSEVDDDWGTAVRRIESIQPTRVPLKIKVVSSAYANWRWIYNKALLPRVPLVGFTVGQLLVVVVYQVVTNLFLLVYNLVLPENFRRPAFLAVSQLPCVFALATKNNILSIIGKGSEKLNFLHRTVGNVIIGFGLLHAFLIEKQLNFKPDLTKRIYLTGVITASSLILILIGSFPIIRHKAYQLFLFTHILGWLTFVIVLNFHVPLVAFPFTAVALGLYALDLGLRLAKTRVKNATLVALPGGVTMIQVHGVAEGWRAGQFVWLRVPMWRMGRRAMEAHPFTIANSAAAKSPLPGRHNLTVLVKAAGDWSRAVANIATSPEELRGEDVENLKIGSGRAIRVTVEGPYGGPMFTDFAESQAVLLIAGGSGITFVAAIFEELTGAAAAGHIRARTLILVWSMKSIESVDWYQDMFNALLAIARNRTSLSVEIHLHATGPATADYSPVDGAILSQERPTPQRVFDTVVNRVFANLNAKNGSRGGGIALGVYGPASLVRDALRAAAGLSRAKAVRVGGVVVYSEVFEF